MEPSMETEFEKTLTSEYNYEIWQSEDVKNYIHEQKTNETEGKIMILFLYLPTCIHCHRAAYQLQKFNQYLNAQQNQYEKTGVSPRFHIDFICMNARANFKYVYETFQVKSFPRIFIIDEFGNHCEHLVSDGLEPLNILSSIRNCKVKDI